MTPESELAAIEAIKQLKARYFRLMDTKQWEAFADVFAPDAVVDVTDDAGPKHGHMKGKEQIARNIERAIGSALTVHHGHMPEITIAGQDAATGIWAMFDYVEFSPAPDRKAPEPQDPSQDGLSQKGLRGYGHYHEKYTRIDGRWHIQFMKLSRLRIDPLS